MLVKNSFIAWVLFPWQEVFHSMHVPSKLGMKGDDEEVLEPALLCPSKVPEGCLVVEFHRIWDGV